VQGACIPPAGGPGWHVQGSGCSTGSAGATWPALAAVALLGLLRGRRRRGGLLLAAALAAPAGAQETDRSFSTQRFMLAPGGDDILSVYSGRTAPPLAFAVAAAVDYADAPLRLVNGSQEVVLVRSQWNLQVGASVGLLRWLEVGLVVPATLSQSGEPAPPGGPPLASWTPSGGLCDPRLVPRVRLLDVAGVGLALVLPVSLPVGSVENYTGWSAVTFTPTAAVEWSGISALRLAGNLGFAIRPSRSLGDLTVGDALGYGLAGIYDFALGRQPFAAMVTLTGEVGTGGSGEVDPLEVLAALRWNAPLGLSVTAGGGAGLSQGYGTPNYRVVASVGFAPWALRAEVAPRKASPPEDESPAAAPPAAAAAPAAALAAASPAPVDRVPPPPAAPPADPVPQAKLVGKRIEVTGVVHFAINEASIDPRSHDLLSDVAAVMRANPQVKKLRIEGNASKDPLSARRKGSAEHDRKLSAARAEAVEEHLVKQGVEASRLESIGRGWESPVASNDTEEGRAKNRRTDFVVVEQ
jgi:MYXO-CTERM domain-containing protein